MFERYTERARRVVFFARYEASQHGSTTIETEHLLLGLIREDKNLTNRFLCNASSIVSIREEIEAGITVRAKVSTGLDLSLSEECKRIFAFAAEEAARLKDSHLGTEHLFLGILREDNCIAAKILYGRGLRLEAIREELARSVLRVPPRKDAVSKDAMVPDANTAKLIAAAIWIPVYGLESIPALDLLKVDLNVLVWRVTGDKLFASIRSWDGQVVAMGRKTEGPDV